MGDQEEAEVEARPRMRARPSGGSLQTKLILLAAAPATVALAAAAGGFAWRSALGGGGLADAATVLQVAVLAAALAVAVGLVGVWLLSRSVVAPLSALARSLKAAADDPAGGAPVETGAKGQVGRLIHDYNALLAGTRFRERMTTERIAALEAELAATRSVVEAADAARTALAAALAQDVRAPLHGAAAAAERLAAADGPRRTRLLEQVARSMPSLLAAFDDLMRPAAPASAHGKADLAELADDVAGLFWAAAAGKGLDLAVYVDPGTPRLIEGDPTRLRQVIGALVGNAIRTTEAGGVLLEIEPDSRETVRISVRDTGAGIARDKLAGVFETASPAVGGLAAVKRLVTAMNGRVAVTSQPGKGSTFALRLPAEVVEAAPSWPSAPSPGAKAVIAHEGVSTRRALGRYLARAGYAVAAPGEEADAAIAIGRPASLAELGTEGPAVWLADPGAPIDDGDHAVLFQPLRREELGALLARHEAGRPLAGASAGAADAGGRHPAPLAPLESRLIDPEVMASLESLAADGKADVIAEVQALYREAAPETVADLLRAAERSDAATADRAIHSLRSMSLSIGAREVARLAGDMGSALREGRLPTPEEVLELRSVLDATMAVLAARPAPARAESGGLPEETRALLDDLERAIDNDELSLVYQPQFDREGRNVQGVETLVRWTHPVRGPISPALFIPIAEEHGRIDRLTTWVMTRALSETADLKGLQVAFNASALEFTNTDIVERLRSLIARTGFDPRRLEVEITETAILAHEDQVCETMNLIRGMGLKVALDDFGAGYSSLSHLRRYPFDKLKIDREFVVDCTRDVQSATVVHAVVSIGRALGMKVVAEGVETEQQRQFLKIAGVHAMQGYLFGRPMPIAGLKQMLAAPPDAERARA